LRETQTWLSSEIGAGWALLIVVTFVTPEARSKVRSITGRLPPSLKSLGVAPPFAKKRLLVLSHRQRRDILEK